MKWRKCTYIFLALMFFLSAAVVNKAGSQYADNTVFIDPSSIVDANITKGETITVGISISFVEGLHAWQVKIRYNPALLYTNKSLTTEGPFLRTGGGVAEPRQTWFSKSVEEDYVLISCMIMEYDYVDGSSADYGYLATVTFIVLRSGETRLEILSDAWDPPKTMLLDVNGHEIPCQSQDGYFRNVISGTPTASFSHFPTFPLWSETVTFNASASSGLDGIARYLWFFGDKNTANETAPITYHKFIRTTLDPEKTFSVRLIVIDNLGMTGNLSAKVLTVVSSRALQDIAVIPPSPHISPFSSTSVAPGGILGVTVLVSNQGSSSANFNATTYYRPIEVDEWTSIATQTDLRLNASGMQGSELALKFTWNLPIDIAKGIYTVMANVSQLINETDTNDNTCILGNVAVTFAPRASFVYEPAGPYVDGVIVFDASPSFDPDGTIKSYSWDFGEWIYDEGNVTTVDSPLIIHSYATVGTYIVALTVTDDLGAKNSTSQWINVKLNSSISLTVTPSHVTLGENVTIKGSISPIRPEATVSILYKMVGESPWNPIGNATTDQNGNYIYIWKPTEVGVYDIKAMWEGDGITNGDESDVAKVEVAGTFNYLLYVAVAAILTVVVVAAFLLRFREKAMLIVKGLRKRLRLLRSNVSEKKFYVILFSSFDVLANSV